MHIVPAGTGTRWRWLVAGLAAATSTALLPATPAQAAPTSQVFTEPGDHQFLVPTGVTQLSIIATGAGGGGGGGGSALELPGLAGGGGGGGGTVSCTLPVSPGSTLYIHVGQGGLGGDFYESQFHDMTGGASTLGASPQSDALVRADGGLGGETASERQGSAPGGSARCTGGSNVVTRPGTVGGTYLGPMGGSGGVAGTPDVNNCPGYGNGGRGANVGSFGSVPGSAGNNGCLVVSTEPPPAVYTLTARHSDQLLDVSYASTGDGAQVIQWPANRQTNQQWNFKDVGGGYFQVVSVNSGKCLDVKGGEDATADGVPVVQWTCGTGTNQQWKIEDPGGGYYRLVARHSNKCLDVQAADPPDWAQAIQRTCVTDTTSQQWLRRQV